MSTLNRTPVFRALTQPQMFGGVTYSYFIINLVVTTEAFLISRSFWTVPVALLVHAVGYLACLREPRIFDIWINRVSKCGRTRTHGLWRCNSYAP
ncbi:MAG: type IV secretion system protein VirB3 [Sphingomonas sp.]|jgi:type IV secretion system protein VirB3